MPVVKRLFGDGSKCVGCNICMMTCPMVNFGEEKLSKSKIKIIDNDPNGFRINVCNNCGICMWNCPENAISIVNKSILIDEALCTLCGVCVEVCPTKSIWITSELPIPNKCVTCGACVDNCPTGALKMTEMEIKPIYKV